MKRVCLAQLVYSVSGFLSPFGLLITGDGAMWTMDQLLLKRVFCLYLMLGSLVYSVRSKHCQVSVLSEHIAPLVINNFVIIIVFQRTL